MGRLLKFDFRRLYVVGIKAGLRYAVARSGISFMDLISQQTRNGLIPEQPWQASAKPSKSMAPSDDLAPLRRASAGLWRPCQHPMIWP
jgi:hypothetical protein